MKLRQRIVNEYWATIQGSSDYPDERVLFAVLYNMGLISYDKWVCIPEKLENLYFKLEDDICSNLDSIGFQCDCCGWWFEWSEQSENEELCGNICENCEDDV